MEMATMRRITLVSTPPSPDADFGTITSWQYVNPAIFDDVNGAKDMVMSALCRSRDESLQKAGYDPETFVWVESWFMGEMEADLAFIQNDVASQLNW